MSDKFDDLVRRLHGEADRAVVSDRWSIAKERELAALFARCAEQALRAPALIERSIHLRALVVRVVPPVLRRPLKVAVHLADRGARRLHRRLSDARDTRTEPKATP